MLQTLSDLVRINSINPAYENGRPKSEIDGYIANFSKSRGIETRFQDVLPGRPNLIAVLPGRRSGRIVLEAHVDTASITGMNIPAFEPASRTASSTDVVHAIPKRAQAAVEYVNCAQVEKAVDFYREFVMRFEGERA